MLFSTELSKGHNKSRIRCYLLPFQAKDAIKNAAVSIPTLKDEHTAQDVEVQLILWDRTHHSGFEEGRPLPL